MKKIYKKPSTEVVNIRLNGSIMGDPNPYVGNWSKYALDGDAKEQQFEWEEEAASNRPRNINLWEE